MLRNMLETYRKVRKFHQIFTKNQLKVKHITRIQASTQLNALGIIKS